MSGSPLGPHKNAWNATRHRAFALKPSTHFRVIEDIPLAYRGEMRYHRSVTERNSHEQTF
jgi:hypothetical protein